MFVVVVGLCGFFVVVDKFVVFVDKFVVFVDNFLLWVKVACFPV